MSLPPAAADRTCLVTGASSGIGAEIARVLASRGYGVALVARREEALKELAAALHDAHKVRTETFAVDLTDAEARSALPYRLEEAGLTVDVLVNNAGFSTIGPITSALESRELDMVRTNVEAVVSLCVLFTPDMADRGQGAVLNVASTAAFQPMPGHAGYAASKSFVLSYSQALHEELRPHGVHVTALCPGPVETGFQEAAGMAGGQEVLPKFMWRTAAAVARAAVDGLAANRMTVIPGAPNHFAAIAAHHTPRRLVVPMVRRFTPYSR
jgi:short-subunit dehydrogenase